MTKTGEDEKRQLLQKGHADGDTKACIGTRMRVMVYIMIGSLGLLVSGSSQTQYIYASLKDQETRENGTNVNGYTNSSDNSKNCPGNASSSDDKVQSETSNWSLYISLVESSIGIPIIIIAGPLVDRIGRKPLLMWNTVITFISFVVKTVAVFLNLNLYYFLIGSVVVGLSGTSCTFNLACLSILADVSDKGNDRTFIMAIYDALIGVGSFLAYVGTGYLIKFSGYTYPFLISTGFYLVLSILIAATLEDSWKPPEKEKKLNLSEHFVQIFSLCTKKQNISGQLNYFLVLLVIFFINMLPLASVSTIRTIFALGYPFCWDSERIGWYGACSDLVLFVCGTIILKILHLYLPFIKDELIVLCGFLSSVASFVLLGLTYSDWMLYVAASAAFLRILPFPILKAIMSRIVSAEKQGVLFSNIYLIEAVVGLVGTLIFNNIYQQTVSIYSRLVFFVMACFPFLALIMMICVICSRTSIVYTELVIEKPIIQNESN